MSDDLKRWSETDDTSLKGFVAALASATPSDAMKERVWSKIAPSLPPTPGSGSGSGGSAIGSLKLAGFAGLVIASGALIYGLTRPAAPPPSSSPEPPVVSAPATIEPPPPPPAASVSSAIDVVPPPPPSTKPSAKPTSVATHAPPSAAATPSISPADRLREEAEGVRRTRMFLRDHNPTAALAELDRLQKLTPNGPLEEEREVLTIEALAMSGKADVAKRRAERFLDERPQSVHAARVRGFAGK